MKGKFENGILHWKGWGNGYSGPKSPAASLSVPPWPVRVVPLWVLLLAAPFFMAPFLASPLMAGWFEGSALAHAPSKHQAKLVLFKRTVPAPGFTLKTPAGETVRLSDFRGKFVLLNYWATWCPPCLKEMPSMQRLADSFKGRPFVVLGISLDVEGASKVKPFLKRLGVTFPIALDPTSEVSGKYGARELPATFLIDPQGQVVMAAKGERDWFSKEIVGYLEEVVAASTSGK